MAQARISFIDTAVGGARTFPAGAYLAAGGTTAISDVAPAFAGTGSVEIVPDVPCRVAIGASPNPQAAGATVLRAGQRFEVPIAAGQRVAVIRDFSALEAEMGAWFDALPTSAPATPGFWKDAGRLARSGS